MGKPDNRAREIARRQREAAARVRPPASTVPVATAPPPTPPALPAMSDPDGSGDGAVTVARAIRSARNRWDGLHAVTLAIRHERAAIERRDRAVRRARDLGATWVQIGAVLNVSPQAAGKRYGERS